MRMLPAISLLLSMVILPLRSEESDNNKLGASIGLPTFEARLSVGFNYDLLRSPTSVSFEYPKGQFGFNLPIEQTVNLRDVIKFMNPVTDSIFADTTLFTNGDDFKPKGNAKQNPNLTVRVDVPMMGGVASFSNVQNFFLNYGTVLGNPNLLLAPDSLVDGLSLLMRGTINVPLDLTLGWETMTFGYAYRLNQYFTFALNLHRHVFSLDLRGKIDIDLLGTYTFDVPSEGAGDFEMPAINGELDYPSEKINGQIYGHYEAEVWSPTFGLKAWRFTLTSRFGVNTRARGQLSARYSLPFFIDPQTFQPTVDFEDPDIINDPDFRMALKANAIDSLTYSTTRMVEGKRRESDLIWRLPQGHTIAFDIVPDKFSFSYTKLFGDIEMYLDHIARERTAIESNTGRKDAADSVVFDFGISVDHVMLLHVNLRNAFLNLGVFAMDFRYAEHENILGDAMIPEMRLGKAAMLPVLNLGSAIGSKLQLLLELDILPLPALRSGVAYFF